MRFILSIGLIAVLLLLSLSPLLAQETPYEKALKMYFKKDYAKASEILKEYVIEKPDAKAYYLLGYAHYKLNKDKEAAEYFKEAYLIDPYFNPHVIVGLGISNTTVPQ